MKSYRIILTMLMMMCCGFMSAQKFVAKASKQKVAVGESFMLSFELNSGGSGFRFPSLNDFDVYSGPNQSQSMSYVNGSMSQSVTFSFILAPKKEGKFTIGAASVNVNGNTIQSSPLIIEVVKGSAPTPPSSAQGQSQPGTENVADNLFIRTTVSKNKAYLGEQITVTQKVYTRYALRGFQDFKFPDYNGFWSQDLTTHQQIQLTAENIDGINYQVAELRRSFIFGQRTGKIEIEAPVVECVVRKQSNKRFHDPFEQIFGGGGYEDVVYKVKGNPVTVEIMPLPEQGRPEGYSGAVGEFSCKVELNKTNVKTNEALNLIVTLTGKGNIKLTDPGKLEIPEEIEQYDPKTSENISVGANGVSGTRTFEYVLIPRHVGDFRIGNLKFSYFDPSKKEYINLPAPELNIHVEQGKDDPAAVMTNPSHKSDLKVLGEDIRYIKTTSEEFSEPNQHFFNSPLFYAGLASPLLAFLLFIGLRRRHEEMNRDQVAVRSRKANAMARKRLLLAENKLKAGQKEEFYAELSRALYGYLADKLNMPLSELSREQIIYRLSARGTSAQAIEQLSSTLDNCEFARYAPAAVSGDLQSVYGSAVSLISILENEIR